tara:strand:+ start:843 stop:1184 length:342 start_codon:yes stop_codon:yes gene_type:complete
MAYVNKLSAHHERLVKTINSVVLRRYIRCDLKDLLNKIDQLEVSLILYTKPHPNHHQANLSTDEREDYLKQNQIREKIAYNKMLIKTIEDSLEKSIGVIDFDSISEDCFEDYR